MTLGSSTHWPDKTPTYFPEKIQHPYVQEIQKHFPDMIPKIHTFRVGHRWRPGMKIHMVTGNRTQNRHQFNANIPALNTCIFVQDARVVMFNDGSIIIGIKKGDVFDPLSAEQMLLFAANDGFNSVEQLARWFFPKGYKDVDGEYLIDGQIIHWTDFKY